MVLVDLAITCIHDYVVVTVTVTKASFIYTIYTPMQIYTRGVNLHLGVFWSCKRCYMKMHPGANLHRGANLLHLCRWCKFGGAN